eukprot:1091041-Pleurochrysis_carterae.AAC.2
MPTKCHRVLRDSCRSSRPRQTRANARARADQREGSFLSRLREPRTCSVERLHVPCARRERRMRLFLPQLRILQSRAQHAEQRRALGLAMPVHAPEFLKLHSVPRARVVQLAPQRLERASTRLHNLASASTTRVSALCRMPPVR